MVTDERNAADQLMGAAFRSEAARCRRGTPDQGTRSRWRSSGRRAGSCVWPLWWAGGWLVLGAVAVVVAVVLDAGQPTLLRKRAAVMVRHPAGMLLPLAMLLAAACSADGPAGPADTPTPTLSAAVRSRRRDPPMAQRTLLGGAAFTSSQSRRWAIRARSRPPVTFTAGSLRPDAVSDCQTRWCWWARTTACTRSRRPSLASRRLI